MPSSRRGAAANASTLQVADADQRPIRVLVDIVHPADVLFFRHPIRLLQAQGNEVLICSRKKDITIELLDDLGLPHTAASRSRTGLVGMATELLQRDMALLSIARRFRPDVMVAFGGVSIAHVGWLRRIPTISFYDTEAAILQNLLTFPFISKVQVPTCYTGRVPRRKTAAFNGYKEMSYLHPGWFRPDAATAEACGLARDADNFFVRIVNWQSNHDIGKAGWRDVDLERLVEHLARRGRVHISAERPLPPALEPMRYRGKVSQVHHLLAACRLYVGESATMAAEAALLAVPSVYTANDYRGYTEELHAAGLIQIVSDYALEPTLQAIEKALAASPDEIRQRRDAVIAAKDFGPDTIVEAILRLARRTSEAAPARASA